MDFLSPTNFVDLPSQAALRGPRAVYGGTDSLGWMAPKAARSRTIGQCQKVLLLSVVVYGEFTEVSGVNLRILSIILNASGRGEDSLCGEMLH